MTLVIFMLFACIAVSLCHSHTSSETRKTEEEEDESYEPGTRVTESHRGGYDDTLVIDFTSYDGPQLPEQPDIDRSLFVPAGDQLVPTVPVDPRGSKYAVVPSKQSQSTTEQHQLIQEPTLPIDFVKEITGLKIPYLDSPSYIPPDEERSSEEEAAEEDSEEIDEDVPNHDKYFTSDFLEPPEFKTVQTTSEPERDSSGETRDTTVLAKKRQKRLKPVILTKYRSLDDPFERYEVHEFILEKEKPPIHKIQKGVRPTPPLCDLSVVHKTHHKLKNPSGCRHNHFHSFPQSTHSPLKHYPHFPKPHPPPPLHFNQFPFHHPSPLPSRHPPVFLPHHTTQFSLRQPTPFPFRLPSRNFRPLVPYNFQHCSRPQKIVKEVHFHHYDPSENSVIYGVNDQENLEHESVDLKGDDVRLEEDVNDYHSEYNDDNKSVDEEIEDYKRETETRLRNPEYFGEAHPPPDEDSYPPYHSDSSPQPIKKYSGASAKTIPLQQGEFFKHKVIKYFYKTH